ncbi:MAG: GH3 auxin-responsive promoter family protein [Isosphaeraceae bacterium]
MGAERIFSQFTGHQLIRSRVNRAFHRYARRRTSALNQADPPVVQARTLQKLIRRARGTQFGRDHRFSSIRDVDGFRRAVPLRTYESLWNDYLARHYPVFENLTWPGQIPYLALTSGTTQGTTKYIPISRAMIASNEKAARTMVAYHMASKSDSHLFNGKMFLLGGSSNLDRPAPGVRQGDLSGIAARAISPLLRPYVYPPLKLALEPDWDRKIASLAQGAISEPMTLISGVPSWLLALFHRVLQITGKSTIAEVWPTLEVVVHGGVRFDPYRTTFREILGSRTIRLQESYPCSEGFIAFGDPVTGLLRLCYDHGLFYEFVPVDELESPNPTRHWLGTAEIGVNYAIVVSTCAGLWAHVIGDTVRFESLSPPLLTFTGRTRYSLSAFGEHLISEEVEGAVAEAAETNGAAVRDWHVGPVVSGDPGYHQFIFEFLRPPGQLTKFREALDASLCARNDDYRAHRADGVGLPLPAVAVVKPGGFEAWMRFRGRLGGQNKLPRMDGDGNLTSELIAYLRQTARLDGELPPG